jgi:methylmalonyl-CoA carboxyltransferase large subunit
MSALAIEPNVALVDELQKQIADLAARLEKLEGKGTEAVEAAAPAPAPLPVPARVEEISPELLLVISAAVAAYLGERGHVKSVRLVGSTRWAQQGRVSIQASHRLSRT